MAGPNPSAPPESGRVIASYGRQAIVEGGDRQRVHCKVAGRRLEVVCGDEVQWQASTTAGDSVIIERLPRRSALLRTDGVGRAETIVANITQLVVVVSPKPAPDFFIVDRYVAAAELLEIGAILVLNKIDLEDPQLAQCRAQLAVFEQLGYPLIECSAELGTGIEALRERLQAHTTILVGQSGAGKSSLANRILPGLNAATSALSRSTAEGKHTTSVSTLHHLPTGGDLIDSPGVRDFAPAIEWLAQPAHGFREFSRLPTRCKFNDCRHLREPDCAVRTAVDAGVIAPRRYESYKRLVRLSEDLAPDPGRKRN